MEYWMAAISTTLLLSFLIASIIWMLVAALSYVFNNAFGIRAIRVGGMLIFTLFVVLVAIGALKSKISNLELLLIHDFTVFDSFGSPNFQFINWLTLIISKSLVILWFGGVIFGLMKLGRNLYDLHTLYITSMPSTNLKAIETLNRISGQLGIRRKTRLLISPLISTPITLGVFKPIIYFPIGLISGMNCDELDVILRHELAHIKRYDYLINLFLTSLEIIFFFNPIVLIMVKDLRREMEFSCDDAVLKFHKRLFYAQTLVKLYDINSSNRLI